MRFSNVLISILGAAALTLGAASTSQASGEHEGGHNNDFAFGQPVDGSEPDRTIEIAAKDSMDFHPRRIDVKAGEVVRLVIKNTGSLHHSFTLGSSEWHHHHEQEMQGMAVDKIAGHMRDEPNGIVVAPGETRELTWEFEQGGTVEFACHIASHYPAGMKGRIDIN